MPYQLGDTPITAVNVLYYNPNRRFLSSTFLNIGQLPVDRRLAVIFQESIHPRERPAAEETAVGRERTGMRGLDDEVMRIGDHRLFPARRAAPENERHRLLPLVQQGDDLVREGFPALPVMRVCCVLAHREDRVEEQHALIGPRLQAAIVRDRAAEIRLELLEYIEQRRRRLDARLPRSTSSQA